MILNIDLSQTDYFLTESEIVDSKDQKNKGETSRLPWDDESYDSNPALFPFFIQTYLLNDSVRVKFSHISKDSYDFYSTLQEVEGQNPSSTAPANPTSNFSNGAIGNFGAFSTFDTTIVITP